MAASFRIFSSHPGLSRVGAAGATAPRGSSARVGAAPIPRSGVPAQLCGRTGTASWGRSRRLSATRSTRVRAQAGDEAEDAYFGPVDGFQGGENGWAMDDESEDAGKAEEEFDYEPELVVQDDLSEMLELLPAGIRATVENHPDRVNLLEVVLDLGRRPEARFLGANKVEFLREEEVSEEELKAATQHMGAFGGDNRAGIPGTLHRISCIRNRRGDVVGLTCRVGRTVTGHVEMIRDLLEGNDSLLFLGRPGVGKTTVIRELARVLADELHKRVVIVDTSNEIGGDGDVPHPAIGGARRMQVPEPALQHRVMIEAVENHMPEVIIVDEIGTEAEALACRTIAERGVMLVGTAHGQLLENLIKNPTLSDLVGGVHTVTLGDDEARIRGTSKSILERKAPPTFPVLLEMRERAQWVEHRVDESVDAVLAGKRPNVQVREADPARPSRFTVQQQIYDRDPSVSGRSRAMTELEADAAFGSIMNSEDPYSWAQRLGAVPDKDLLEDLTYASNAENSRFSYTGNSAKRGRRAKGGGGRTRATRR